MRRPVLLCLLGLLWVSTAASLAEVRDGKMFDAGLRLEAPADNAPEALGQLSGWVGDWDLELVIHRQGQESQQSVGIAKVTYMNRGHGLMERTRIADIDGQGHSQAILGMVAVNGNGVWTVSEGDSWREVITIWSGAFAGSELVLHDAGRPGGGSALVLRRRTYAQTSDQQRSLKIEVSRDFGVSWTLVGERTYRRRSPRPDFFPVGSDIGLAAPDRPAGAAEFDFLLGEFQASHFLQLPQGPIRLAANASAVRALDGHGILEFGWHDLNPALPNAATTILRIYNRSMRHWESLFLSNRTNTPLHFGGVREGRRIVLHPFAAQTGSATLWQWIFFDQRPDAYRWKGLTSNDRGRTQQISWTIDFVRQGTEPAAVGSFEEVRTSSSDGLKIVGDHYRAALPAATTVLLFHQAGANAQGEYGSTARRLAEAGFEVFAWDARGGGDRFDAINRTLAASPSARDQSFCAAYPDLQAALRYAVLQGSGGPIFVVGSSYSAALVVRLAAEHGPQLAGVAAFSPASGRMEACAVDTWLPLLDDTPLWVARPEVETTHPGVIAQAELLAEHGVEVLVVADASHGAAMLDAERSAGDVEETWQRLLAFFADPKAASGPSR